MELSNPDSVDFKFVGRINSNYLFWFLHLLGHAQFRTEFLEYCNA